MDIIETIVRVLYIGLDLVIYGALMGYSPRRKISLQIAGVIWIFLVAAYLPGWILSIPAIVQILLVLAAMAAAGVFFFDGIRPAFLISLQVGKVALNRITSGLIMIMPDQSMGSLTDSSTVSVYTGLIAILSVLSIGYIFHLKDKDLHKIAAELPLWSYALSMAAFLIPTITIRSGSQIQEELRLAEGLQILLSGITAAVIIILIILCIYFWSSNRVLKKAGNRDSTENIHKCS